MKTILIVNGPNLSMLGKRDPKHYGSGTLKDLENACVNKGIELGVKVECFQSESESAIIRKLHMSMGRIDGIVTEGPLKTKNSYRKIVVPADVMAVLKDKQKKDDDQNAPYLQNHMPNSPVSDRRTRGSPYLPRKNPVFRQ